MRSTFLLFSLTLLIASPAMAYVGPGPGMSMIGSFFSLIGGIFIAFFLVLLYPIRLLIKRMKRKKSGSTHSE